MSGGDSLAARIAIITVPSASHAIKGETALNHMGLPCRLVPVPRTLSSQCGVCLRVEHPYLKRALDVLEAASVSISGVHDLPDLDEKGDDS